MLTIVMAIIRKCNTTAGDDKGCQNIGTQTIKWQFLCEFLCYELKLFRDSNTNLP